MDKDTNKQITLAEAISKIETLTADNGKLKSDLDASNTRITELESKLSSEESAHTSTKESLTALEGKQRDMDKEVAEKVAAIAAEKGVDPIPTPKSEGNAESIEDLVKRIDSAQGVEKAKLIEANADRISAYLRGGAK